MSSFVDSFGKPVGLGTQIAYGVGGKYAGTHLRVGTICEIRSRLVPESRWDVDSKKVEKTVFTVQLDPSGKFGGACRRPRGWIYSDEQFIKLFDQV